MRIGSAAPDRCVKCNEPAVQPIKARWMRWHHPGWYLLIFINVLIYVIVGLFVRKKARVALGLCAKHYQRRRVALAIGTGGFVFGLLAVFYGMNANATGFALLGAMVLLAALLVSLYGSRIAYPSRITKEEVRLKGCGAAFLDSLENTQPLRSQGRPA